MKLSRSLLSLTLGALVMGWGSAAHAYSINITEVGKRIRWAVDTVPLQIDPALYNFLPKGDVHAALEMGFEAWRGLSRVPDVVLQPGAPVASPGNHGKHPTNGVYLLKKWPYERTKLAITVVTYETETGRLLDADILVNGTTHYAMVDESNSLPSDAYDLPSVLTHEVGHVLGLGESALDPVATMYPYAMPGNTDKRTLSDDDENGVIDSYHGAPPAAASGCGALSVAGRAHAAPWLLLAVLGLFCAVRLRRSASVLRATLALAPVCMIALVYGFGDASRAPAALEMSADSPLARSRLAAFLGDAPKTEIITGRATRIATTVQDGLFFTDYTVRARNGRQLALRVAGGVHEGIGQRLLDGTPLPAEDQDLAIALQADGTQHWAYLRAGTLVGGHLGEGPAIAGAL